MHSRGNHGEHYCEREVSVRISNSEEIGYKSAFPIRTNHRVSESALTSTSFVIVFSIQFGNILARRAPFVNSFLKNYFQ